MLQISSDQMAALRDGKRREFLRRCGRHLDNCAQVLALSPAEPFISPVQQARLDTVLAFLRSCGFDLESDIVGAMELIEIFRASLQDDQTRQLFGWHEFSPAKRLDLIWSLVNSRGAG